MKRTLFVAALGAAILGFGGTAFADGAKVFAAKCANCHGKDGKGQTAMGKQKGAKDLNGAKGTVEDIIKIATDGKKNDAGKVASPAFKGKISDDDIKAVSEYVKTTFMK